MSNNTIAVRTAEAEQSPVSFMRWFHRPNLRASALIVMTGLWVCLVDNATLWSEISQRLAPFDGNALGYVATLLGLMMVLLVLPLLLIGQRFVLKPALLAVLLLSGVLAYFTRHLGVVFDLEMVRNVTETVRDANTQEGLELLSWSMLWSVLTTTAVPAAIVLWVRVDYGSVWTDTLRRLLWAGGIVLVAVTLVMFNFRYITYVSRENSDLEVYLTPFYPIKTASQLVARAREARAFQFTELGDDVSGMPDKTERTVGIMVVGETARRSNFSLNGYERQTNPELAARSVMNFRNVTSCGTSTAFSVPCMFSFLGQDIYTPEKAEQQSNVLDVLQKAGVKTVWVDSNSSCKGVCRRIENTNLLAEADVSNSLFVDGAWHDEILLENVDQYLDSTTEDVLLVLHTMGSHGPAYFRRYPDEFARFTPYCHSKAPQDCTEEEIVNAYDNTILYTDHVLASLIDRLDARDDNSFLFYSSDHGESLGENGVYLHGLPRFLAPAVQREIPMLAWFSAELQRSRGWPNLPSQVRQIDDLLNHDNISASLLGLYQRQTALYKPTLDLFTTDRMSAGSLNLVSDEWSAAEGGLSGNSAIR